MEADVAPRDRSPRARPTDSGPDPDRDRDAQEDADAGAEIRVVKRCLRRALNMDSGKKDILIEHIESLVRATSRLMHHGSLLATHYVLDLLDRDQPVTDALLSDQTFYRQCMSYAKSSTKKGAYPAVKDFADAHRGLIPDTHPLPHDGNCINAAARKLKASVLTMLSHRFRARIFSAVQAAFPVSRPISKGAIVDKCMGRRGAPVVLGREEWEFVDAVRRDLLDGAPAWQASVENAVHACRGVKKDNRAAVTESLVREEHPPQHMLKRSSEVMVSHVLAFLPLCREAGGPLLLEEQKKAILSRLPTRTPDATRDKVLEALRDTRVDPPAQYKVLVSVARSMLACGGTVTTAWLKRNPSRALLALHGMLGRVEEARTQATADHEEQVAKGESAAQPAFSSRPPRLFPLLPLFGQRRQMISIDAETLLYLMKTVGILKKGTKVDAVDTDFRRSILHVPKGFPLSENTSVETDGVAVVLRVERGTPLAQARRSKQEDADDEDLERILFNDPGVKQVATLVEWKRGEDITGASYRMTSKEYYSSAGIDRRMAERRRRDRAIASEQAVLVTASLKTASVAQFQQSLEARRAVVEKVWEHKLGRWTSMMAMAGYAGRRRAVDRFWRHKVGLEASWKVSRTAVVFGDGKFSATAGRQRAVPRRAMEASAARFARKVLLVNEAYTTKVCSKCHQPTMEVKLRMARRNKAGEMVLRNVVVQGLRRCLSNACSATPLKRRDIDASLSQSQIFFAGDHRPECYTRRGYEDALVQRMRREMM